MYNVCLGVYSYIEIIYTFSNMPTENITLIGAMATAIGTLVATIGYIWTYHQKTVDKKDQQITTQHTESAAMTKMLMEVVNNNTTQSVRLEEAVKSLKDPLSGQTRQVEQFNSSLQELTKLVYDLANGKRH